MKTISLQLLEGLIHNLRSPLNVIIGYSQKVPDENATKHIYAAGINMDDQLQHLLNSLYAITEDATAQSLSEWLEAELVILKNLLPIKRQFTFELPDTLNPIWANFSGQLLSQFTEEILLSLASLMPHTMLTATIELDSDPALIMMLNLSEVPDNLTAVLDGIGARFYDPFWFQCQIEMVGQILSIKVKLHE